MIGDVSPPVASIPVVEGKEESKKHQNLLPPFSKVFSHFGTSGVSVALATGVTHPLDVLKVRLQMQHVGQRGHLIGMAGTFLQLIKNEGARSLYLGLTPALTRSVLYGGLRLGLYEPTKISFDWAFGSTNVFVKIASGAFAGAFSTALTNPVEVVKVRLQMNPNAVPISEVREIVSKEGIGALWKGVGPAMVRAAALTASQLATYDEAKRILVKQSSLTEGFHLHLCT
ncbi:PREDICTED: mitochondrial substrate carrier family protein ucpB-like isoform X3 [Camelina sativa]|uniref:Mitochondrial substrate carrier family protein ucpB-like isoform X3 n=1 Tax=Camelina sativa TaxID=90675 RepID=A0ABM1QCH5_CAMSA|nr:PREDICTED: mitochondrial substrate carrier family protein ucpB-like isoform X3 [Camelina sativa]